VPELALFSCPSPGSPSGAQVLPFDSPPPVAWLQRQSSMGKKEKGAGSMLVGAFRRKQEADGGLVGPSQPI